MNEPAVGTDAGEAPEGPDGTSGPATARPTIPEVEVADDGLVLDGVPAADLADAYGTPVFCLLESRLSANADALVGAFAGWDLFYAVKANPHRRVLAVLRGHGLGAEVMSAMELAFAEAAGFAGGEVLFNGPAKSDAELARALKAGARLHVDHLPEAERLKALAGEQGIEPRVAVRVHPELPDDVARRAYVTKASKLGVDPDLGVKVFRTLQGPAVADGLHVHVGTDQRDPTLHGAVADFAAGYVGRLADEGIPVSRVNLGGGIAARMDLDVDLAAFRAAMEAPFDAAGLLGEVRLELEPGRVAVADAVACIARVVAVKKTWGKTWVLLDAGASTLIPLRYTDYRTVSHRPAPPAPVDVGGPLCLPVDVVETAAPIAPEVGDLVAVLNAGAYTLTMAETFGTPRPPVCAVRGGDHARIRRAETVEGWMELEEDVPW